MGDRSILRQLKRLERVFAAVEPKDDWIEVLMWGASKGGVFGHLHYRYSESRRKTEWTECTEEEELSIMREHYEDMKHRIPGDNAPVAFSEFLEYYSYLSPAELAPRQKEIIEKLREEEKRSSS